MKVADLMNRIQLHEIALPQFQREYVWDVEQARQLLQSLYHGYPTGSLLFWETTSLPATKQAQKALQVAGQKQIILDGQQRLTTLYLLTKGEPPPYYSLSEIEHDPRRLNFDLVAGTFRAPLLGAARPPACIPVPECFRGEPDLLSMARTITGVQQGEAVTSLMTRCIDNLSRLRSILDYDYPVQIVPISATLDDAIDVFDRVNSSGTKLTPAELALTHISGKWPEARQAMKELLHQLAEHHFRLDLDLLVRSLAGVVSGRSDFAELHYLPVGTIQQGWKRLAVALTTLIPSILSQASIISDAYLSSMELLIPLAVYLSRNGGAFPSDQMRRRAIYWLYVANMWGRYTSEFEQRLTYDLSIMQRSADPWNELVAALIEQRGRIDVRPSDFEGRGPDHPLYRMMLITLAARGATDWSTGIPLSAVPQVQRRPLFPLLGQTGGVDEPLQRKQADEIANQVLLVNEPDIPLLHMLSNLAQHQPQLLEQHYIPNDPSLWQAEQISVFLNARREQIATAMNTLVNAFRAASVPPQLITLRDLRMAGEGVRLEYKTTLRWDVEKGIKNEELEQMVVKTIAAFLNTQGGFLLIGVQDDGEIYGIEHDFATTKDGDEDWFERHLRGLINTNMGMEYNRYVQVRFVRTDEGTVCLVRVIRSPHPVFCRHKKEANASALYIRTGNATNMLPTVELGQYISSHWKF